jgi:hypothetical protein
MSKRKAKKRARPNLPQSTLDRARRQVDGEDVNVPAEETTQETADASVDELTQARLEQQKRIRERKRVQNKQSEVARSSGELDQEYISDMLANPVKVVTEEQMHEEYGHVVVDLRNMGLLAGALLVLLVILAQVL